MIKCDFCGCPLEATRAHLIVGPKIEVTAMNDKGEAYPVGIAYDEHWAACDVCHARFMMRNYDAIIADLLATMPDEIVQPDFVAFMSGALRQVYSQLTVLQ